MLSVFSQNSLLQLTVIFNMIPQIWVEYALNFKWKPKGKYPNYLYLSLFKMNFSFLKRLKRRIHYYFSLLITLGSK